MSGEMQEWPVGCVFPTLQEALDAAEALRIGAWLPASFISGPGGWRVERNGGGRKLMQS